MRDDELRRDHPDRPGVDDRDLAGYGDAWVDAEDSEGSGGYEPGAEEPAEQVTVLSNEPEEAPLVAVGDEEPKRLSPYANPDVEVPFGVSHRRAPSTLGGAVFLVVLVAHVVGLVIAVLGAWRAGITVCGIALMAGGLVRAFLPDEDAGMLWVRRRVMDVVLMAGCGAALVVLALTIPSSGPPLGG